MVSFFGSLIAITLYWVCYIFAESRNAFFFKPLFILITSFTLIMYDILLGPSVNVEYMFLPLIILPFLIYKKIRTIVFISALIPLIAFFILDSNPFSSLVQPIAVFKNNGQIINLFVFITAMIILLLSSYFAKKNIVALKEIETKSLTVEVETLKKIMAALHHTINNLLVTVVAGSSVIQSSKDIDLIHDLAQKINHNGKEISDVLKKMSKIKKMADTEYADGIKMLDLDQSE